MMETCCVSGLWHSLQSVDGGNMFEWFVAQSAQCVPGGNMLCEWFVVQSAVCVWLKCVVWVVCAQYAKYC